MIIKILSRIKQGDWEKVRFVSERNNYGIEIRVPANLNDYDFFKYIENYINSKLPIEINDRVEEDVDTSTLTAPEEPTPVDPTQEDLDYQAIQDKISNKNKLAEDIHNLLDGIKQDTEMIAYANDFSYTSTELDTIINNKKAKWDNYVTTKNSYESLKTEITSDIATFKTNYPDSTYEL